MKQARSGVVLLLALGLLGVASCGEDAQPPEIVGTYVLDKEATKAVLRAAAAAPRKDASIGGMLPIALDADPGEGDPGPQRRSLTLAVEAVEQGEIDFEVTLSADGRWIGTSTREGQAVEGRGTWTLRRGDLTLVQTHPSEGEAVLARYQEGVIQLLTKQGTPLFVLKQK